MSDDKRLFQVMKLGHVTNLHKASKKITRLLYNKDFFKELTNAEKEILSRQVYEISENIQYSLTWLLKNLN